MLKYVAVWFNSLPSPLRHSLLQLFVTEAAVIANAFAGANSFTDLKFAVGAVALSLITGAARWAQKYLAEAQT